MMRILFKCIETALWLFSMTILIPAVSKTVDQYFQTASGGAMAYQMLGLLVLTGILMFAMWRASARLVDVVRVPYDVQIRRRWRSTNQK